jgi:hypothetical protein
MVAMVLRAASIVLSLTVVFGDFGFGFDLHAGTA